MNDDVLSQQADSVADDEPWHLYAPRQLSPAGRFRVGINALMVARRLAKSLDPSKRIRVVIFDTGVDYKHPSFEHPIFKDEFLEGNIDIRNARDFDHVLDGEGRSIGEGGRIVNPIDAHGTACAGIVGAALRDDETRVVGVAPDCILVPLRISTNFNEDSIIGALRYAAKNGDVILLPRYLKKSAELNKVLTEIAQYLPVVCAAGNDGRSSLVYPASVKQTIAVGACNDRGFRSTYSQYGDDLDVVAPSNDVPSEDRAVVRLDAAEVRQRLRQMDQVSIAAVMKKAGIKSIPVKDLDLQLLEKISDQENWSLSKLGMLSIATTDNQGEFGYNYEPAGSFCKANGSFGFGGTSAAAAQIAGVVALMLTANSALKGQAEEVKKILRAAATHEFLRRPDGKKFGKQDRSLEFGSGLVDAEDAVKNAEAWVRAKST